MPPNVAEVRNALWAEKPAACSCSFPWRRAARTCGEKSESWTATLPVALHEREDDVLSPQAGQQLVGRRGTEPVVGDLVGEDRVRLDAGPHRAHLVVGEAGRTGGGDRRAGGELHAGHRTDQPDRTECRHGLHRRPPVSGRDPGEPQHRQRGEDEHGQAEHCGTDQGQVGPGPAEGVAQRLDADPGVGPVRDRVERPVERREEPDVEDLHQDQQTESEADQPGQDAPSGGGQDEGQGDDDDALDREPDEGPRGQSARLVRRDEGDPHQHDGEHGAEHSQARSHPAARRPGLRHSGGRAPARSRCDSAGRGVPVAPEPPHVAAERLGEQGQCHDERSLRQGRRQDVGSSGRQHDPLDRRDDLAPVARRQRVTQPWQQPPGNQEEVAGRADREHPRARRAGDVHAEDEDQERVDLTVEAGAQRRRRPRASRHPSVDRVEDESSDGEDHQHRDRCGRCGLPERHRGQRRDPPDERGPDEGHPVGRTQSLDAVPGEATGQCAARQQAAGDAHHPARAAEPDRAGEGREQRHLGDQPAHRAGLNRSHRASVSVGTSITTGNCADRFTRGRKVRSIVSRLRRAQP